MSLTSPDARAVVYAIDALTTQVRRIADALPPPADDAQTTPAPTCAAHHFGTDSLRQCIRAAHHKHPSHTDAHGFHWTDADAVYPADMRPTPAADEDQTLRWTRRESLLVLLTRLQRGRQLSEAEADTLRQHVETEIREANVGREEASYYQQLSAEQGQALSRAEATRAEAQRDRDQHAATLREVLALFSPTSLNGLVAFYQATEHPIAPEDYQRWRAALDGTEQPTTDE